MIFIRKINLNSGLIISSEISALMGNDDKSSFVCTTESQSLVHAHILLNIQRLMDLTLTIEYQRKKKYSKQTN